MRKIEHLGIAVKDLNKVNEIYKKLFQKESYKQEIVDSEHVGTSFFKVGETKIEFLEATSPDSPIQKYIDKKGEGIHHIAFDVEDIYAEMKRLKAEGFEFINPEPKDGADGKIICFIHPRSTNGILVELCQDKVK